MSYLTDLNPLHHRFCRFAGSLEGFPNPQFIRSTSAFKRSFKESASSAGFSELHWFNSPQLISTQPQCCVFPIANCADYEGSKQWLYYRDIIHTQSIYMGWVGTCFLSVGLKNIKKKQWMFFKRGLCRWFKSQSQLTLDCLRPPPPPPSGWVSYATTPTWPGVRTACLASLSSWRPNWTSSRAASSTTWKNTAIRCTTAYVSFDWQLFVSTLDPLKENMFTWEHFTCVYIYLTEHNV